jgi:hypothetical protein
MTIETNFNQSPFFDDFDENKNFHRVLFRPGFAVQARELTQLQTIFQNQIERFANEVLIDGTIVSGVGFKSEQIDYVKLRDKDANNATVLLTSFFENGVVANAVVTGESTGITAQLIDAQEGSESAAPNYLSLFVKYTNSGSNNTVKAFGNNEVLIVRRRSDNGFLVASNTIVTGAVGKGLRATVSDGVIYHKGHFIRVAPQSHVFEKYSTTANKKIGFQTVETTVDSNIDSSLLDNATGTTNFAAPGASRLKLSPTLTSRPLTQANTTTFFTIAEVREGLVTQKFTDTVYSDIAQYIAQRQYETNGNYATDPFNIRIREHLRTATNYGRYNSDGGGDANKLVAEIEKGTGYVNGNRISLNASRFKEVDKATDFETKDARVIGQAIGNYVFAKEVVGTWDFQGLREISLRDSVQEGVTSKEYGDRTAQGTEIGTAKIRGIQYASGSTGTVSGQVRLYIFDVQMNSGKTFSDVRGLHITNSGPNGLADLVLESGNAVLKETGKNTLVFPFTQRGTKTLKDASDIVDTQFVFTTEKTVSFVNGVASVSANTAHAGGTETLNDTGSLTLADRRNVIVVTQTDVDSSAHSGNITDVSGTTVDGDSSCTFLTDYEPGELIKIINGVDEYTEIIASITNDTQLELASASVPTLTGVTASHKTSYPSGRVFNSANLTVTSSSTAHSVTIDPLATTTSTISASVYFDVLRSSAVQTSKVVNKDKYVHINTNTHSAGKLGPYPLGVSDAYKITAVYVGGTTTVTTSDTDQLSEFELVTGQKDSFYDTSYLKLKDNSSLDLTDVGILVKFNYFGRDRTNGIGFLSVDSYPINDTTVTSSTIKTEEIPIFTSPTSGKSFDLRDSIDFRPIKASTATPSATGTVASAPTNPTAATAFDITSGVSGGAHMPTPDENFQCDVQFYLPRKDRIVLTKEGNIEVVKGVPSITPRTPLERAESMSLGTLDIPVYPSLSPQVAKQSKRQDYAVKLTLDNNRRYTMKDLRAVESRIKNLEYYASLNALETSAKNKQIFGSTGLDRFKNGFLVDNFDGHNRADTTQVGYRAAVDRERAELRPSYVRRDISVSKDVTLTSTNLTQKGNLITLPYTHSEFINQKFASKLRNPVQELTFNWRGEVVLNPSMDNTPDITELPDIQVDFDGMYQAIEEISQATGITGVDWGNWNTLSRDVDTTRTSDRITTRTQTEQIREGIQTSISPSGELFSDGNFVQNVAVRDYMRSRNVQVTAFRMKPSTRVYPYFDDELVTSYVTPADSSFANTGSEGDALVTDSTGTLYANFRIPNDENLKFRIGTKRFQFKDVANTQTQSALVTTSAHGDFTSIPLSLSTRGMSFINLPQLSKDRRVEERTLTSITTQDLREENDGRSSDDSGGTSDDDNSDPLTQTFTVSAGSSEGIFVTKIDIFFGRVSSTLPITLQIREVENGFPTQSILPFGSKTLQASEITGSKVNASTVPDATSFEFDSPVFLKNGVDYCFTLLPGGNSDEYAVWVGELGGTDISTSEIIHKQPYSGIMFTSANDKTWSPIQSEDIKFTIHRANFSTSTGTLYLENDDVDFFTYSSKSGTFNIGEKVVNAATPTPAHGFVKFVDYTNKKIHVEGTTGDFSPTDVITGTVSSATAQLSSIDNVVVNTLVPKLPSITYANTSLSFTARTSSGVIGSTYSALNNEVENDFLDSEKKVYSKSNESGLTAVEGSTKTLVIKGSFNTTDPNVSPILDTSRTNAIGIENIINNTIIDEHKTVGNASVRYFTKPVELEDGQEAEDLKVFLTAYKPSGTGVSVYARIINPEDSQDLEDKDFTPLTQITPTTVFSDSVDRSDFKEFEYGFSANTDGQGFLTVANSHARLNSSDSDIVSYRASDGSIYSTYKTFAIKIVMTSTGTNIVPLVRDMRAIALQK